MKLLIYLIAPFLILSCASNENKRMELEHIVSSGVIETKEDSYEVPEDAYIVLITEKLQDHLDKQILALQHPEFKTEIDSTQLFDKINLTEIQQINLIGQPEIISDSITKLTTTVYFKDSLSDTIVSYIKTATTIIDGVPFRTTSIEFRQKN